MIDVYVSGLTIDCGRQGENLARNIIFELRSLIDTYGEGTATLVCMRPSDKVPYVCETTQDDAVLTWTPTSTDTAYAGAGKCELRWVVGETLAKSIIYTTTIAPSITGAEGVPDAYRSWYDAMMDYIKANYAANGAPQEVREAIYTLLSKAAYTETGLADELAIVQAWTAEPLSVTNNLTHVTNSNTATMLEQGASYTGTLTADTGYTLGSVAVTMGGVDITATVYSSGTITIPSVTGDIVITATAVAAVSSLSAVYTQSDVICDLDSLDILKSDLVVTATYSDSTTATISSDDYTLSGTLEAGTSTITVLYGGATATFNVTVNETLSVMTSPITMYPSNSLASWSSSTETGEIHETSSTAGWTNLVLQGLSYKRSDVATKKMRVECDLVLSGIPNDTTTRGVLFAAGLFTSANPTNSGTQRKAGVSLDAVVGDGTHHYSYTDDIATLFTDTTMNSYYLGLSIFLNQVSPAAVTISNLRMVVY